MHKLCLQKNSNQTKVKELIKKEQLGPDLKARNQRNTNVKNGKRTQAHGRSESQKRPSDYGSRNASNKNDEPGHSQVHGAFLFCEDGRVSNDWRRKLDYFPGCLLQMVGISEKFTGL